jgi:hypothetical protein
MFSHGTALAHRTGGRAFSRDWAPVDVAVRRFGRRIEQDAKLRRKLGEMERHLLNVEM